MGALSTVRRPHLRIALVLAGGVVLVVSHSLTHVHDHDGGALHEGSNYADADGHVKWSKWATP